MNRRVPLLPTVIFGLVVCFLVATLTIWLKNKFELPDWIIPLSSLVDVFLFFEIVTRLGPPESDTPISKFLELSVRDRIVTAAAILALVLIAFPIGYRYDSLLFRFLFPALGVVAFWLICFIFGSERVRRFMLLLLRRPE